MSGATARAPPAGASPRITSVLNMQGGEAVEGYAVRGAGQGAYRLSIFE